MAQPDLSLPEGPLLRALASSSLSRRRAAMASLSTFLSKKQNFTQLDFLKLWKGLFYCLYMTPKMLHQQRLSIEISELTYALRETSTSQGEEVVDESTAQKKRKRGGTQSDAASKRRRTSFSAAAPPEEKDGGQAEPKFLSFVGAFWTTIAREWEGIDKARLDKFLFLVRRMVFVGFEGCKVSSGSSQDPEVAHGGDEAGEQEGEDDGGEEYEWSPALLSSYLEILKQGPLDAGNMKLPIGLQLHVLDVLVDEMERADPERKLDTQEVVGILEGLKRESKTKTVRKRAGEVLQEGGLGDWASAEGGTGGDVDGNGIEGDGVDEGSGIGEVEQDEEEKENEEEDGEDGFEGFDD